MVMQFTERYDAKQVEPRWVERWEKLGINSFDAKDKKRKIYAIDTPPPTVSGIIHVGHSYSYGQMDFIARFWRMQGYNIFYPFGFDDNGLATEIFVEKSIGKSAEQAGRRNFVELCMKHTTEVEKELKQSWMNFGLSVDWSLLYRTINKEVMKKSQLSFIELYKKGREYQKEAPTIWCPRCQTAIAQVELEDKELPSQFIDLVFKLEGGGDIIIATTRPEFLASCVAVFVHPDDKRYRHLAGKKAIVPLFNQKVPIFKDIRADPEKGTGIVMCCTFGDLTDMDWWYAYKLPLKLSISREGKMTELAGKYQGLKIEEARKLIIEDLKKQNLIKGVKAIKHEVNVHERCSTPIEFLITKQWFIRYLDLKDKFLRAGKKINWYPLHMRTRYENWIKGLQWDWCISRQRYFGIPFPVWYCRKCNNVMLADEKELPVDPLYDKPKRKCRCGSKQFIPERDILDTWATSSLTPMIPTRWHEDNKYFNSIYPMTLRPQAHDIITFWLFNTVVKSLLHENKVPWKDTMISGHALDPHSKKMSKSKGNVFYHDAIIEKYSADCLRYWAAASKLGDDLPFQEKDLVAGQKFMTKLWNASRFTLTNLEGYNRKKKILISNAIDRWILSKLNRLIEESTANFKIYEYARVKNEVEYFFWHDFCDNYLEIVKDRLYNPQNYPKKSKEEAQQTLYNVLIAILKMMAPFLPFITEEIFFVSFASTEKEKSIHVSKWPSVDKKLIDKNAENVGALFVDIVSTVRKFKSSKHLSLKEEIKLLTIECSKNQENLIKNTLLDLKGVTKAKEIRFAKVKNAQKCDNFDVKIEIEM